jgi:putative RecB family exonuclease
MSKLEMLTGKTHLSYSAVNSLATCGEQFRLERVVQVPQEPAWWFIGGTAFHTASEALDRGDFGDPEAAWQEAWNLACEKDLAGADPASVRAGGRATKEWPKRENEDWWQAKGPGMLEEYQAYTRKLAEEGWQLYRITDDMPAIELQFGLEIGDVLVKGAIDRVYINPDGELVIQDLKAGSRQPDSAMQLGIYSVAFENITGMKAIVGNYYMARKGEATEPVSLLHYTKDMFAGVFATAKRMIEAEIFLPHISSLCTSCGVRKYCTVMPGSETV